MGWATGPTLTGTQVIPESGVRLEGSENVGQAISLISLNKRLHEECWFMFAVIKTIGVKHV